jgi:hypothetical protein
VVEEFKYKIIMENNEENKIQDAKITEEKNPVVSWWKKIKKENWKNNQIVYFELALFFILGVLIGIAIKTEAVKRVSIGFNDYKMKVVEQDYDFSLLEKKLAERQQEELKKQNKMDENQNNPEQEEGAIQE